LTCSGQPRPFVQDNGERFPKLTLLNQNLLGQRGGVNPSTTSTPHLHPALARKSGVHPLPQGGEEKTKLLKNFCIFAGVNLSGGRLSSSYE